jgi:hypothetical protein
LYGFDQKSQAMFDGVLGVFGRGQEARSEWNSVESNALRYKNALPAFGV